jgi:hypothetical protein
MITAKLTERISFAMRWARPFLFLSLPALLPAALSAEVLGPGHTLRDLEFKDQHDRLHRLSENLRFLVFSADMGGSRLIQAWMKDRNDDYLKAQNIALLADIHRMPYLISKTIALPRMRNYTYSLLLIQDEGRGSIYPQQPEAVTVLVLKRLTVESIHYATTPAELQTIIDRNR